MDKSVQFYIDDDAGYLKWLHAHPDGFVVNTERNLSPSYLKLHRAQCGQLHRHDPRQSILTGEFVKVGSMSIPQLEKWLARTLRGHARLDPCRLCKPE